MWMFGNQRQFMIIVQYVQFHVCENLIGLSLWISHIFIYGTVMYSVYDYFISYMYNIYSVFRFFDQF